MPCRILRATIVLVVAATPTLSQDRSDWTRAIEPFRIAENLYYVGSADLTSFLFTDPAGHVLIDAPLEENVDLVLANIRELGFEPRDIRIQLASHGHFDHTGGVARMLESTGADLVLSEAAAVLVGAGGRGDFHLGDRAAYRPADATRTVAHLETVRLGATSLQAHLTPGHTRGCTSWSGTVRIGEEALSFVSICSLTALPGYRLAGSDPSYAGIATDFCTSIAHLRSIEPEIFLASHGSFIGLEEKRQQLAEGDARAFVDPQAYRDYLDRAQERIEKVLADQGESGGCAAVLAR